jgi:hypothetical protein
MGGPTVIIRLTHAQWQAVRIRITQDLQDAMVEHRRSVGKKTHEYLLPAVAWRRVLDQLTAVAYGPLGGKVEGGATLYRAIQKIADAVGRMETHPALKVGRAVTGFSTDVIPAWERWGAIRSPYPCEGEFLVLWPEQITRGNHHLTVWVPRLPDPHQVLHDPVFHLSLADLALVGGAGVPEVNGGGVEQLEDSVSQAVNDVVVAPPASVAHDAP